MMEFGFAAATQTTGPAPLPQALADSGWASLPVPPGAEAWRHRAAWLRAAEAAAGGGSALPNLSEAALLASLPKWLGPYAAGVRSRAQLAKLDWAGIFRGMVGPQGGWGWDG
jgi:ATP-dependent helicase HrpB